MKPSPFDYARATSLTEALALLERHGEKAQILAGGQTLIATLNMRLSAPDWLIDITRIPGLSGVSLTDTHLVIGALTTHREIERSALVAQHAPLLTQAAPHIAHAAIRNSGTIGGSIAFADPAAEWPACCVALDAQIVIRALSGERRASARTYFRGLYDTDRASNEIITAIEIPRETPPRRSVFMELARRHGDYAIVGLALLGRVAEGRLSDVAIGYVGAGATPLLARGAMAALEGQVPGADVLERAKAALTQDLDPSGDLYNSPATKRHLAAVLLERAVKQLLA